MLQNTGDEVSAYEEKDYQQTQDGDWKRDKEIDELHDIDDDDDDDDKNDDSDNDDDQGGKMDEEDDFLQQLHLCLKKFRQKAEEYQQQQLEQKVPPGKYENTSKRILENLLDLKICGCEIQLWHMRVFKQEVVQVLDDLEGGSDGHLKEANDDDKNNKNPIMIRLSLPNCQLDSQDTLAALEDVCMNIGIHSLDLTHTEFTIPELQRLIRACRIVPKQPRRKNKQKIGLKRLELALRYQQGTLAPLLEACYDSDDQIVENNNNLRQLSNLEYLRLETRSSLEHRVRLVCVQELVMALISLASAANTTDKTGQAALRVFELIHCEIDDESLAVLMGGLLALKESLQMIHLHIEGRSQRWGGGITWQSLPLLGLFMTEFPHLKRLNLNISDCRQLLLPAQIDEQKDRSHEHFPQQQPKCSPEQKKAMSPQSEEQYEPPTPLISKIPLYTEESNDKHDNKTSEIMRSKVVNKRITMKKEDMGDQRKQENKSWFGSRGKWNNETASVVDVAPKEDAISSAIGAFATSLQQQQQGDLSTSSSSSLSLQLSWTNVGWTKEVALRLLEAAAHNEVASDISLVWSDSDFLVHHNKEDQKYAVENHNEEEQSLFIYQLATHLSSIKRVTKLSLIDTGNSRNTNEATEIKRESSLFWWDDDVNRRLLIEGCRKNPSLLELDIRAGTKHRLQVISGAVEPKVDRKLLPQTTIFIEPKSSELERLQWIPF